MPPLKKTDLEKVAWTWTELIAPDKIERKHLETSYRIGLKKCKNCKRNCSNNPQCLTGLGEDKYLKSQPAEIASLESSLLELRDPTQYVGLKNLGATCYVNSLIQVWFHNEDIRKIIYKWESLEDREEREALERAESSSSVYHPVTAVGQLQYIFAMMQFGNKRLIDPTSLAIALSLDVDAQQDAQEFSKLLLAHIENKFQNINLKSELQRLTQGTYTYVNRCSTCLTEYKTPTTFYELDLQLAPTLKEAIETYLTEEELVGPNKYLCRNCNEKQDAKRFIRLETLPDTLNFQLLRFVFHRESNQKKKLSSYIQFPEELDMSKYLGSEPGTCLYSLVAVLSHKGSSAHSGHYIVTICNSNGEWYQFSDDKVELMQNKRIEDGCPENGKIPKKNKVPKGCLSSNAAYMLVYKKLSPELKLKKKIDKRNNKKDDFNVKNDTAGLEQTSENNKRKESDSDSSDNMFSPVKKVKTKHNNRRKKNNNNNNLTDENNKKNLSSNDENSDNKNIEKLKNIKEEIPMDVDETKDVDNLLHKNYQLLNGDAHRAMSCSQRDSYEAAEFRKWQVSETLRKLIKDENDSHENGLLDMQQEKLKQIEEQNMKRSEVIDFYNIISNTSDIGDYIWLPTNWITKWLNDHCGTQEGLSPIINSVLTCPHGRLDPSKVHKTKCVPAPAVDLLTKKFDIDVILNQDSLCDNCVRKKCKALRFKSTLEKDHKEVTEIIKSVKEQNDDCYIIGAESLKNWRKLAMDRHEDESKEDNNVEIVSQLKISDNEVEDDSETFKDLNDDLLCCHKGLRIPDASRKTVPEAAWTILKKYFPHAAEYKVGTPCCQKCAETLETAQKAKEDDKIKSKQQKESLSDLYYLKNRNEISKKIDADKNYYIVEKSFLDSWRAFIRCNTRPAPVSINNRQLLCEKHKGFLYPVSTTCELYGIVSEYEWNKLNEFYESDFEIKIRNVGKDEPIFETDPENCNECMEARKHQEWLETLNYDHATIYILCVDEGEECESTTTSSRSCRTRRKTKGTHELKVSSQTTLKELKVMTMNICGAPPFDQHLSLGDVELIDSDQTLGALGVSPNVMLKLKVDTPLDTEIDLESDSTSREASSPEKGFKGTELVPS